MLQLTSCADSNHVLSTLDATSSTSAQVGMCTHLTRSDVSCFALSPRLLSRETTVYSVCACIHHSCCGTVLQ